MANERHLLHLFSTFTAGGPQVRTATIIDALPEGFRHTIVGLDGDFGCKERLEGHPMVAYADPPKKGGLGYSLRLGSLIAKVDPGLVLTYNWGAIEAIPGARLRGYRRIVHAEDGFGPDEAEGQVARRVAFRRLVFPFVTRVVVPSFGLEKQATQVWRVPPPKLERIQNGIDLAHYAPQPGNRERAAMRARWRAEPDDLVIGTVARLRAEKGLDRLVRLFAQLAPPRLLPSKEPVVRLVLVGDGPEEKRLRELAHELRLSDRVHFTGPLADARDAYLGFDVFAMSSHTEQMPIALIEAMGCALPVVSTDVGDVATMVAEANRGYVVPPTQLADALDHMLRDPAARAELGRANRAKAEVEYRVHTMIARYVALYESALGLAPAAGSRAG